MKVEISQFLICLFGILLLCSPGWAEEQPQIDASDPTKIYSYLGGGPKYTSYTNDEHMWEFRLIGNLGLGPKDMVLVETGYGQHSGDSEPGSDSGLTNTRARWFHLFDMDYEQ